MAYTKIDISQTDLARLVGASQAHISNVLSATRRPSWRLAKALGRELWVDPEVILDGSAEQIDEAINAGQFKRRQAALRSTQ